MGNSTCSCGAKTGTVVQLTCAPIPSRSNSRQQQTKHLEGTSEPRPPVFSSTEIPHLLEETAHFTDEALLRVGGHVTVVLVGEEVVAQDGSVGQRLQDAVHEACVAQVDQPAQT